MDMLSPIELMEIASTMQSKAQKKIMKAQRKEDQTIQSAIDILFSILSEIYIDTSYTYWQTGPTGHISRITNEEFGGSNNS